MNRESNTILMSLVCTSQVDFIPKTESESTEGNRGNGGGRIAAGTGAAKRAPVPRIPSNYSFVLFVLFCVLDFGIRIRGGVHEIKTCRLQRPDHGRDRQAGRRGKLPAHRQWERAGASRRLKNTVPS